MLNKNNSFVKTLSSVEFALFIISAVAITSIIGTIIPQGESVQFYAKQYGSKPAIIFELLDLTDMYSSYWFNGLLILFCLNLVVCTWVRLPGVLAIIRKDSLTVPVANISGDKKAIVLNSKKQHEQDDLSVLSNILTPLSTKNVEGTGGGTLFLHEKSAWSRLGAYIVHASIIVIICGALVGKFFGYKAFIMVPEGSSESSVHKKGDWHKEIPLGFEVFCQNFKTDYYENGMPKEYKSDLLVFEGGKEIVKKTITVNDPLKYRGVTFFQSSYRTIDNEYKLMVTKKESSGAQLDKTLFLKPFTELKSEELGVSFRILATAPDGHGHGPYRLQLKDNVSSLNRMLNDYETINLEREGVDYTLMLTQRYATGLQVVKDPGVWIVYIGCGLMMFGLYVSFFMSHLRVWVLYQPQKHGSTITIVGKTNKNNMKLEQLQEKIVTALLREEKLDLRRA